MIKNYLSALLTIICGVVSYSQNLSASIDQPPVVCTPGDCTSLNATYTAINETTSYQVNAITYQPVFASEVGSATQLTIDDRWSGVIDLKGLTAEDFNFCFYGQTYNKVLVSTNGAITFSIQGVVPGGLYTPNSFSTWVLSGPIPYSGTGSNAPFKNSINGIFQDTNPGVSNSFAQPSINFYTMGAYPNRAFVLNFSSLAQYGCSNDSTVGAQTSQIVLYESTNIIDIFIQRRTPCLAWSGGNGLVGIQNVTGTLGAVPAGRNTGTWSATNEAWRFSPSGNPIVPTVTWTKDGNFYATGNPVNVCPMADEQYDATVSYSTCNGALNLTDSVQVDVSDIQAGEPTDMLSCGDGSQPLAFDLAQNTPIVLGALDPMQYVITYHTTLASAQGNSETVIAPGNLSAFMSLGQTIFVRIEDFFSGCIAVKNFDLVISPNPPAPTGNAVQNFIPGETLSDIEVNGTNIQWYGSSTGTDLLPNSTLLIDGATYYASQTNAVNCESRTLPSRLAVTVYNVLSATDFSDADFKTYPNPVKDVLNLSYISEMSSVVVYNMIGQEVLSKKLNATQSQLNMADLSSGNYIVKVNIAGAIKTFKVVKQ